MKWCVLIMRCLATFHTFAILLSTLKCSEGLLYSNGLNIKTRGKELTYQLTDWQDSMLIIWFIIPTKLIFLLQNPVIQPTLTQDVGESISEDRW